MTGKERREQLLDIGRRLFAERGLDGTSIEEIAAKAGVSKPVVYEHFGGKEGLYAVVVDREVERFLTMATRLLEGEDTTAKFEVAAVALLSYIQENSDGFRILVRDSNPASGSGTFASLISDIASQVEYILGDVLKARGYDPKLAPMYAQMLVGMVAFTGQWWLDARKPKLEEVAAHLVIWPGTACLSSIPIRPSRPKRPGCWARWTQRTCGPGQVERPPPPAAPKPALHRCDARTTPRRRPCPSSGNRRLAARCGLRRRRPAGRGAQSRTDPQGRPGATWPRIPLKRRRGPGGSAARTGRRPVPRYQSSTGSPPCSTCR